MATSIGQLLLELRADTSAFVRGLSDAKDYSFRTSGEIVASLEKIGQQITKLNFDSFRNAAKSFENLGAVLAGVGVATVAAVVAISESVAEQAKTLDKLAQSYGLSIETVSSLRVASKLTGVELETLTAGLGRLAKNAATVAEGVGRGGVADAFRILGINVADSQGHLLPMSDLLGKVATAFSGMENSSAKTALAIQLFGRAGAALIPFLNQGADGIKKLQELSDELGITWTDKDIQAARVFGEQVELLELKSSAFKEQLAKGVLPALDQLTTAFIHVDANGRSIAKTVGEDLGIAFKFLADQIVGVIAVYQQWELEIEKSGIQLADWWTRFKTGRLGDPIGDEARDKLNAFDYQIKGIQKTYDDFVTKLNAPVEPLLVSRGGTGAVPPSFGKPEDIDKLASALERMRAATDRLLDKAEGDKLQGQIDAIAAQIRTIQGFAASVPGKLFVDLNGQVSELTTALIHLKEVQTGVLSDYDKLATRVEIAPIAAPPSISRALESLKGVEDYAAKLPPSAVPTVKGNVQQQAELASNSKLQEDANYRNQEAFNIYQQLQPAGERWGVELQKLNLLLADGNISQETYDYALTKATQDMSAAYDPAARYAQSLAKIADASKAGLLTPTAAWKATRDAIIQNVVATDQLNTETNKAGSGMAAALHQFQLALGTTQQIIQRSLTGGLSGITNSFKTFFSDMIVGTKTVGQAFSDLGLHIIESMASAAAEFIADWLAMKIVIALFGDAFSQTQADTTSKNVSTALSSAALAGANTLALTSAVYLPPVPEALAAAAYGTGLSFAAAAALSEGGLVKGTGTSTSDSIPARLSNQEFVVRASAVQNIGVDTLEKINNNTISRAQLWEAISNTSDRKEFTIATTKAFSVGGLVSKDAGLRVSGSITNSVASFSAYREGGAVSKESVYPMHPAFASAAAGMIVDRDQFAAVHADEHILPANIARTYEAAARGLASASPTKSSSTSTPPAVTLHFTSTVHALDSRGVAEALKGQGKAMMKELRGELRNLNITLPKG